MIRRVLAAILVCLAALPAHAAEAPRWQALADTIFHAIAQDDTLPNGAMPQALAEDAQGFLWVGTQNGLARWDGNRFLIYRADADQPRALPGNVVSALHRDDAGRLWVGTEGGGLARYDPAGDDFAAVALDPAGPAGDINAMADDGAGGLWVATMAGLFELDHAGRVLSHLRHAAQGSAGLPEDRVLAMLRDASGALWGGGPAGLWRCGPGASTFVVDPSLSGTPILSMALDDAGRIWVGTSRHGAWVIGPGDRVPRRVRAPEGGGGAAHDSITSVAEVRRGEIWLGTGASGIIRVDAATLRSTRLRHEAALSTSLLDGAVAAILRDKAGLAWIATNHGVTRTDPGQRGIVTIFGDHGRPDGLSTADVLAVLAAPDGRVWAGTRHNGVDILDPAGWLAGRIPAASVDDAHPAGGMLPPVNILHLAAMADGTIFVGTTAGLFRVDPPASRAVPQALPGQDQGQRVWSLRRIGDVLWLGGPSGLWALRQGEGHTLTVLRHIAGEALSDPRVRSVAPGPDGALWVGTPHGLNLLPAGPGPIEKILNQPGQPASLSSNFVITLLTDRLGRLWVGTLDRGLNLMLGRDAAGHPVFRRFGAAQGVPNDSIDALLLDRQGMIWASTDGGLMRIDPASLTVHAYTREDGVAIPGYYSNAAEMTRDGDLVFGGMGGLSIVQPALLARHAYHPPVVVTQIRVGGRVVQGGVPAQIVVPAAANALQVEFAAFDFMAPERLRYAYRLDGYDAGWVETDAVRRVAAYTNLAPGTYVLRLRGTNRDGVWSDPPVSVSVRVLPAWYQTWWFRLLALAGFVLALWGLSHARTAWVRQRQRELERQVSERTADLLQAQAKLHQAAYADLLTGLGNRRAFNEQFTAFCAGGQAEARFVLLLIDLDGFKQVNDTLGHDVGDAVLVAVAARLRATFRGGDCLARLGGDEFAVLLSSTMRPEQIDQLCLRLIAALSRPIEIQGGTARIGASIGVAEFPDHGASQALLFKSADLALYEAKRSGRGRACRFGDNRNGGAALAAPPPAIPPSPISPDFAADPRPSPSAPPHDKPAIGREYYTAAAPQTDAPLEV